MSDESRNPYAASPEFMGAVKPEYRDRVDSLMRGAHHRTDPVANAHLHRAANAVMRDKARNSEATDPAMARVYRSQTRTGLTAMSNEIRETRAAKQGAAQRAAGPAKTPPAMPRESRADRIRRH